MPGSVLEILRRSCPDKALRMTADYHQLSIGHKQLMPGPGDVQIRQAFALHRDKAHPCGILPGGVARSSLQEQEAPYQQQIYSEDFFHTIAKLALSPGTSTHASGKSYLQFPENASREAEIFQKSDKSSRQDAIFLCLSVSETNNTTYDGTNTQRILRSALDDGVRGQTRRRDLRLRGKDKLGRGL